MSWIRSSLIKVKLECTNSLYGGQTGLTQTMLSARRAPLLPRPLPVTNWAFTSAMLRLQRGHGDSGIQRRNKIGKYYGGATGCVGSSQDTWKLAATVRRELKAGLGTVTTMDGPPSGYRANVGICLVNSRNEVFVAARVDIPEAWQMPQGGIDAGEEPRDAAIRELKEETGVTSAEIIGEVPEWLTYEFPPEVRSNLLQLWGEDWTGQAQKWFLFRFYGEESEIHLAGDGEEPPEFSEWKWIPVHEVVGRAVQFKKPVYARAFEVLTPIIVATLPAS